MCSKCGHIEDVVTLKSYEGKGIGKYLTKILKDIAAELKCYKVILDCKDSNIKFYELNGFEQKEKQMVWYN